MSARRPVSDLLTITLALFVAVSAYADIWYVDKASTSNAQDGTSWQSAFATIQPAIDAASDAGGGEVWVAAGLYDENRTLSDISLKVPEPGPLFLRDGVDVYGGFSGVESSRESRDWEKNVTVIDGSRAFEGTAANHVLYAANSSIDGFTVTGGRADSFIEGGGAMLVIKKSPRIANCVFRDNRGFDGAAVISQNGYDQSTSIVNCTFTENEPISGRSSSCIEYIGSGDFHVINCVFTGNGVNAIDSRRECDLIIDGCKFYDQADFEIVQPGERLLYRKNALYIGGSSIIRNSYFSVRGRGTNLELVRCDGDNVAIENSVFVNCGVDNPRPSGVIAFRSEAGIIRNCLFYNNNSAFGLIRIAARDISVVNCTIVNNWGKGTALVVDREYITGAITPTIQNCIVWGNSRDFEEGTDNATVSHSLIGTGFDGHGEGNLAFNPLFRDAENGDFRLRYDSPCIDAGTNVALHTHDLNGRPRVIDLPGRGHEEDNAVDMGVYETPMLIHVNAEATKDADDPDGYSWNSAFPTLQEGIDAAHAAHGGEVWVAKGTYGEDRTGNFTDSTGADTGSLILREFVSIYGGFLGDEVSLGERDTVDGPEETIIDGAASRSGSPAYHVVVGANHARIDGFTIRGGRADGTRTSSSGAGMWNKDASPRIENMRLRDNIATHNGGGISNTGHSSPTIVASVIESNTAGQHGGGVHSDGGATVEIVGTTLESNSAANGGAIAGESAYIHIKASTLLGNSASDEGGAVYGDATTAQIDQTIITRNTAQQRGGASVNANGEFGFVNCLIAENESVGTGGAVVTADGDSSLLNCTVAVNRADSGSGGIYSVDSHVRFENSIAWGNGTDWDSSGSEMETVRFSNIGTGYSGGVGNLSADPLFLDIQNSDFRLGIDSPCIDAGSGNFAPAVDLLGKTRPTGWGIEIGAYEKLAIVYVNKSTPAGADTQDGRTWETAFDELQEAVDEAHAYGGKTEVWVAAGVYDESRSHYMDPDVFSYGDDEDVGCLVLRDGVHLYGGFKGDEADRSERDWNTNTTVIDGANSRDGEGSIYMICAAVDSHLDGFTITGKASSTALIALEKDITIENCIFRNLTATSVFGHYLAELVIRRCTFVENASDIVDVRDGCKVTIEDSLFSRNSRLSVSSSDGNTIRIERSTFSDNSWEYGVLYSSDDAQVAITDCTFARNHSGALGDHIGIGVLNFLHSSGSITNSGILDNVGGVAGRDSNVQIRNSTIKWNSSIDGGGVYVRQGATLIENCLIAENHARRYGGGVCAFDTSPLIMNTILSGNTAGTSGGASFNWGKDVRFNYPVSKQFGLLRSSLYVNCTIVGNSAPTAGGVGGRPTTGSGTIYDSGPAEPYARNCIFWDNAGGDWVILATAHPDEPPYIENCIINGSAGPKFVDPSEGDFRLTVGSPAIDAGLDYIFLPTYDYYGGDRVLGAAVDLGAHEFFAPNRLGLADLPSVSLDEDTQINDYINLLDFTTYDSNIDPRDDLTYSIVRVMDSTLNVVGFGQHVFIDESNNIDILPAPGFFGELTVTVQVTDGTLVARSDIAITISSVDDPTSSPLVSISPNPGYAGVPLTCRIDIPSTDQDVPYVTYEYHWLRSDDGTNFSLAESNATPLLSDTLEILPVKGEYWKCIVFAHAGETRGASNSDTVWITADSQISDLTLLGQGFQAYVPYQAYVDVQPQGNRDVTITYQRTDSPASAAEVSASHTGNGRYVATITFAEQGTYELQAKVKPSSTHLGSQSNSIQVTVSRPSVNVTLNSTRHVVRVGESIEYTGALEVFTPTPPESSSTSITPDFSGLPLDIDIYFADELVHSEPIETTDPQGLFSLTYSPVIEQEGRHTAIARFGGTSNLNAGESQKVNVDVRSVAGYALLIIGESADAQSFAASQLTAKRVYTNLQKAGYKADDVHIVNGDPDEFEDGVAISPPTKVGVEQCINEWATAKLHDTPAPFYIVVIGDGGDIEFMPSPEELNNALHNLANEVATGEGQTQPIVIVNGFPGAGSSLDALSYNNSRSIRVVIASADTSESSISGPIEPSGKRDGDLYVSQLFTFLSRGYDLHTAHVQAATFIREYTANIGEVDATSSHNTALQHPLLDDNGDGKAYRYLTAAPVRSMDGFIAKNIYLGFDEVHATEHIRIAEVSPSLRLPLGEVVLPLYINTNIDPVNAAWLEMKRPTTNVVASDPPRRLWLNSEPPLEADERTNITDWKFDYRNVRAYEPFDALGTYTIYYFLEIGDGTLAPIKQSKMYRTNSLQGLPPQPFTLLRPDDGAHVSRVPIFDWSDSVEEDSDTVSYTLVLQPVDTPGANPIVIENIPYSNYTWHAFYDDPMIASALTVNYTWDVLAVDGVGISSLASNGPRTLAIDNRTHARPDSTLLVHVMTDGTSKAVTDATVEAISGETATVWNLENIGGGNYYIEGLPSGMSLYLVGKQRGTSNVVGPVTISTEPLHTINLMLDAADTYDINGDGRVDSSDIQTVINIVLGSGGASSTPPSAIVGDVDGDDRVASTDIQMIINRVLGIEN